MITNGFVEVTPNCVHVLSEVAATPAEIEENVERNLVKELREKLEKLETTNNKEFNRLKAEIERSMAKLQLL